MPPSFPPFDHASFLDRAWRADPQPQHNLGSSSLHGGSWQQRGLPPWPSDFDPAQVNLKATADLRSAVARHTGRPEEGVMVTVGTTGANLAATLWAYRPGCNVVIERPVYSPLAATAQGIGADVRFVDRRPGEGWRLHPDDVAAAVDADTALIVLASPNNPTQAEAGRDDLLELGRIAEEVDAHVLVDQVYSELTDTPRAAGLHPRILSSAGFNKSWGLPTIRVGWLTADPAVIDDIHNVHMQTLMSPSAPLEAMATRLLEPGVVRHARRHLEGVLAANHSVYQEWLDASPEVDGAGFRHLTAFPRLPIDDTAAWGERAYRAGVVAVPGEYFGRAGHVRIGLGGDAHDLREGLRALTATLPSQ